MRSMQLAPDLRDVDDRNPVRKPIWDVKKTVNNGMK